MANFNRVIIAGHLTRDPQLKFVGSNLAVAEFGVACNRKYKLQSGEDREEVLFVDVTAFGKSAELISQHLTKGNPILIEGRLKFDQWEDKQSGAKRSKISVVLESFQFLGGKDDAKEETTDRSGGYRRPAPRPAGTIEQAIEPGQQFKDEDIPF